MKLKQRQNDLEKVYWGEQMIKNCWIFEYLGSLFQADGDQTPDIKRRIAMAVARAGKLRHIWAAEELTLELKLRLYKAACCSILTYGSEAWILNEKACKLINGANASMLSHITNRSRHEEAKAVTTTFNLVQWIRARRLKWVNHILRMAENRLVHKALLYIYNNPQSGDLLMDTQADTWNALKKQARNRDAWRLRVSNVAASNTTSLKPPLMHEHGHKTRFHLKNMTIQKPEEKKRKKTMSNEKARTEYYKKVEAKTDAHQKRMDFFKPRGTTTKSKEQKYTFCTPKWDTVKQQVFSATSSSADELSNDSMIHSAWASKMKSSYAGKLWKAAATANASGIDDNENGTHSASLWAAAADIPESRLKPRSGRGF